MTHFKILLFVFLFSSLTLLGQVPGFVAAKNVDELKKKLRQKHQSTQTLKADFTQEKHLTFMKDKAVSKGILTVKQGKKIRIEYTSPFVYLVVINEGKLYIKDGKKVTKVNIDSDKSFSKINEVLLHSIDGNLEASKEFMVSYWENKEQWLLQLTPTSNKPEDLFQKINVYFDKATLQLDLLQLLEKSGDQTKMKFENPQINIAIPDETFVVR